MPSRRVYPRTECERCATAGTATVAIITTVIIFIIFMASPFLIMLIRRGNLRIGRLKPELKHLHEGGINPPLALYELVQGNRCHHIGAGSSLRRYVTCAGNERAILTTLTLLVDYDPSEDEMTADIRA